MKKNKLKQVDIDTIFAYAACNMSRSATARALYMHRNTVAYHLQKVKEVTGLDPRNFYELIELTEKWRKK